MGDVEKYLEQAMGVERQEWRRQLADAQAETQDARAWARRLWVWVVENSGPGPEIPFERDVPAWLREDGQVDG